MLNVEPTDVKLAFIVAQAMKVPFENKTQISHNNLNQLYEEANVKYEDYTEKQLNAFINGLELGKNLKEFEEKPYLEEDLDRVKRYHELSWKYGLVNLNEMGAWPETRGIDPRLTTGNIIDTAQEVDSYSRGNVKYRFSKKRKANIESLISLIESMKSNPLIEKLPLILVPRQSIGGLGYQSWVMENHKDYHEHNTHLLGIDDGNVRALTHVLLGKKEVPSYVGSYKT